MWKTNFSLMAIYLHYSLMYFYILLILTLLQRSKSAEDTEEITTTADFSCMLGSSESECTTGEVGSSRFFHGNITIADCETYETFITVQTSPPDTSSNEKVYACGSVFEWKLNRDRSAPTISTTYKEKHLCFHDTLVNINKITDNSPDGCILHKYSLRGEEYEKFCTCIEGKACNAKFKANFPGLSEEAQSLCMQTTIEIDNPNPAIVKKTATRSSSTFIQSTEFTFVLTITHKIFNSFVRF